MRIRRDALTELPPLQLASPGFATALQHGDRRSPYQGRGVEFADYRPYDVGDDIRLVDWNVYQRLNVALVKRFHEDRSLQIRIFLDVSGSMGFGAPRKADHGAQLAASLALLGLSKRDPVTLCCFGGDARPARAKGTNVSSLPQLLALLEHCEPAGRGDAKSHLASQLGHERTDRLLLISDLLHEEEQREDLLRFVAGAARNPAVLHVLGADELEPPFLGAETSVVVDCETGEELTIRTDSGARRAYDRALSEWLAELDRRCRALKIQYVPAFTTAGVPELLQGALRQAGVVTPLAGGGR